MGTAIQEELQENLRGMNWAGKKLVYCETVDSTNTKAKELAELGYPSGTLVTAEQQKAGRGRSGRGWESPPGTGIFMTLLLRPAIRPDSASMLTLVAALAAVRGVRDITQADVQIKWPNDLVLNGKKICGILTELSVQEGMIRYLVVGIGINVHNESFPEEIRSTASSLFLECGRHFHRAEIIGKLLKNFENDYEIFCRTEDLSGLRDEYHAFLVNRGRSVRVLDPRAPYEGKALGITEKGELIVDVQGQKRLVSSGEVSVRGIYGYV